MLEKLLNFHERARLNQDGGSSEAIYSPSVGGYITTDDIYRLCWRHYDQRLVKVYEVEVRGQRSTETPFRIHIRTDAVKPELICELELAGFACRRGTTCNEWETSLLLTPNPQIAVHPPHMVVKLDNIPPELKKLTPLWYDFLENVEFLGHLMGTMSNGIEVPKQAFGECQTSIVLETYRRAYGPAYKSHQCTECVDWELSFKDAIVAHDFSRFQTNLNSFVAHFVAAHADAYKTVSENPFSYQKDGYGDMVWVDSQNRRVSLNKGRYSDYL